eukprot:2930301-Pleurochrysis_carterae.AAC.1
MGVLAWQAETRRYTDERKHRQKQGESQQFFCERSRTGGRSDAQARAQDHEGDNYVRGVLRQCVRRASTVCEACFDRV